MSSSHADEPELVTRGIDPQERTEPGAISASAFAWLALVTLVLARGIAPALPGTAIGIERWIGVTNWFAACTSQLLAAGGVVLTLRLLGSVSLLPKLGAAYRLAMLPVVLCVVSLVAAAATRPLGSDPTRLLALAALVAQAATLPSCVGHRDRRGLLLLLSTVIAALLLELTVYELARSGGTLGSIAPALAFTSLLLDLAAGGAALVALLPERAALTRALGVALGVVVSGLVLARLGEATHANPLWVLLRRSIDALCIERRSAGFVGLSPAVVLCDLSVSVLALRANARRGDVRTAVALTLLARSAAGTPLSALLSVAGALLIVRALRSSELVPSRLPTTDSI